MFFFCLYGMLGIAMIIFAVGISRSGGAYGLTRTRTGTDTDKDTDRHGL